MDAKEVVKKYWPYMLGGVIALFLIMRMRGGNSSGDAASAFYASQAAAGAAQSQASAQLEIARAQINAQETAANRQHQYNLETLGLQKEANYATAINNFVAAQGTAAQGVGAAVQAMVGSLNAPIIAAMQGSAYENAAAMAAAAQTAAAGFGAQANIVGHTSMVIDSVAGAAVGISNAVGQVGQAGAQIPAGNYGPKQGY